jgi:polyisoprenoid-binding protein YceI
MLEGEIRIVSIWVTVGFSEALRSFAANYICAIRRRLRIFWIHRSAVNFDRRWEKKKRIGEYMISQGMFAKRSIAAFTMTLLTTGVCNAADQWIVDLNKGSGQVSFHAVGKPKMLNIHGKGAKASGQFLITAGKVQGKASFDLKTLDTGIEMRNSHMKEKYLEVGKFPNADFVITEINLPNPLPSGDFSKDAPFKGKLTLHGVTSDVSGIAKINKSGATLTGNVQFDTTVKSFNIDLPSFAGITMADDVKVEVEFSGPMMKSAGKSVAQK